MIVTETVVRKNKNFIHTYSDKGLKIERDGVVYDDAYDPEGTNRVYAEVTGTEETADNETVSNEN